MHVDPVKPTLKAPGIKLFKLKYDKPLSDFAFKFNLRRYNEVLYSLFRTNNCGTLGGMQGNSSLGVLGGSGFTIRLGA